MPHRMLSKELGERPEHREALHYSKFRAVLQDEILGVRQARSLVGLGKQLECLDVVHDLIFQLAFAQLLHDIWVLNREISLSDMRLMDHH